NRQFSPPLQRISQNDHAQTTAAQEQTKSSEGCEDGQVGVLHDVELVQAVRSGNQVETDVGHRFRKLGADCGFLPEGIDQEYLIPCLRWEQTREVLFGDYEPALKDGARKYADDPQLDRVPRIV